ncbi:DMT family transporter [Cohnella sp. AR92]|uniref:DMT family transporter n=1 Tax=Cohnella sp. AR92 TaxID=648716 RepID=UPI000F8C83DD|nr:DMT family transporter [Cohnella sp. AR92]RUS43953.1 DMT family transporter [Cohnella sp. AR92]
MNRALLPALLLLSLIWGGSYYFIKVLVHDFGPWTIVFLRSALGLAAIALIMGLTRQPLPWRRMPWLYLGTTALVNMAIPWAIIGYCETRIMSSLASILNATTPLFSLLLGILFFGGKSRRPQAIGLTAAMAGVVVLLGYQGGSSFDALGTIGMLIASLFYGLGSQLTRRWLSPLTAYQSAFGTLFFAMLGSGGAAFATESLSLSPLTVPANAAALAGLGIGGSGIAYILFYWIVKRGGPVYATMVTYLIPVSSLAWGSLLLQEEIRWNMILGLGLILGGVYMAGRIGRAGSQEPSNQASLSNLTPLSISDKETPAKPI